MKKAICLTLVLVLCSLFLVSAVAENNLAYYEEAMKGAWKAAWRYIPHSAVETYTTSSKPQHVVHFVYPDRLNKAGMTVDSYLAGDETGKVYLLLTTTGDTHGIMSFAGGFAGEVSMTADQNMLFVKGVDGSAIIYVRDN